MGSKTFSLDPSVDVDKFKASLNNGVLVVSAPKDFSKLEENVRRIPITAAATVASIADDTVVDAKEITTEASGKENNEGGNEEKVEIPSSPLEAEKVEHETLDLDASNNA